MSTPRSPAAITADMRRLVDELEGRRQAAETKLAEAAAIVSRNATAALIIQARKVRYKYFTSHMFGEPAWDMLLDLYMAQGQGKAVSISSACIASAAPATTALRWITFIEKEGLIFRQGDVNDNRRSFLELSDRGLIQVEAYIDYFAHWVANQKGIG